MKKEHKSGGGASKDVKNAEESSKVGGKGATGPVDASGPGSGKGHGTMSHFGEMKKHGLHHGGSKY